jgi:hypothetical protein
MLRRRDGSSPLAGAAGSIRGGGGGAVGTMAPNRVDGPPKRLYDNRMALSYRGRGQRTKAVTVRVPRDRLERLMRIRKAATQSELFNELLAEEEERVDAEKALRSSVGAARPGELDDRLL